MPLMIYVHVKQDFDHKKMQDRSFGLGLQLFSLSKQTVNKLEIITLIEEQWSAASEVEAPERMSPSTPLSPCIECLWTHAAC